MNTLLTIMVRIIAVIVATMYGIISFYEIRERGASFRRLLPLSLWGELLVALGISCECTELLSHPVSVMRQEKRKSYHIIPICLGTVSRRKNLSFFVTNRFNRLVFPCGKLFFINIFNRKEMTSIK